MASPLGLEPTGSASELRAAPGAIVPVFVTQEQRNYAGELVRQLDGQFSTVPLGAIYEEIDADLRQYVFRTDDGNPHVVTYARYDFVGCDTDPHERGLMAAVWSDRPLDAGERERVIAALRVLDSTHGGAPQ